MAGKRPELTGGGLIRSSGGWSVIKSLRRANIHFKSSEVITQILKESGMMNVLRSALLAILITVLTGSCSVISQQIRTESIPSVNFKILLQEPDKHLGDTVILGGYILETKNLTDQSIIRVLQAPLGFGEEPESRDYSEGRFIISQKGFLDPEIYTKDRKITVAGTVVGSVFERVKDVPKVPHIVYFIIDKSYST